jgi:hypothetical protein
MSALHFKIIDPGDDSIRVTDAESVVVRTSVPCTTHEYREALGNSIATMLEEGLAVSHRLTVERIYSDYGSDQRTPSHIEMFHFADKAQWDRAHRIAEAFLSGVADRLGDDVNVWGHELGLAKPEHFVKKDFNYTAFEHLVRVVEDDWDEIIGDLVRFENHYRCSCGAGWSDTRSDRCDNECPKCGAGTSPYESEDIEEPYWA